MLLSVLLGAVAERPAMSGAVWDRHHDPDLARARHDSRSVAPGDLFCCIAGANHDGHDLAAAAVEAGAAALLCERPVGVGVTEVVVGSVREAIGPVAATLAGDPSRALSVVGVTGTNGKTTTVHLLVSIFEAAGLPAAMIGTLTGTRTTPEAPELQDQFASMVADGRQAVAVEVSSHALDLHRVDGTSFAVTVFLNLSRDHLDHHRDMAAYFAAKARLFEPDLSKRAVVNLDDPHGRLLRDAATIPTVGFSMADAQDLVLATDRSTFTWRGRKVDLALPGRFNVQNALAAATAAAEAGLDLDAIAAGLTAAGPVPGRFETVNEGQRFLAVVDFSHTPDGLEQMLNAARELAGDGRVLLVFGAGGDRDRSKRPLMGAVAARLADVVVVTSDNPRTEDPDEIIEEVKRGMEDLAGVSTERDRREAIALAVSEARPGDVLVVAGRGHETTQDFGDRVVDFDDRIVLREAILAAGVGS